MGAIRNICLLDDIRYLRDLVRINVMSPQMRELINDILDDAERHRMRVTLKQFHVLRTHLSVKIKAKKC